MPLREYFRETLEGRDSSSFKESSQLPLLFFLNHFRLFSLKFFLIWFILFLLLSFSHLVKFNSLRPMYCHARPLCPSPSPKVCPSSCPLHRWWHPEISSSDTLFSSALNLSQHQGLFQWVSCSHQMTKILEFQLQHQSFKWVFRVDFS